MHEKFLPKNPLRFEVRLSGLAIYLEEFRISPSHVGSSCSHLPYTNSKQLLRVHCSPSPGKFRATQFGMSGCIYMACPTGKKGQKTKTKTQLASHFSLLSTKYLHFYFGPRPSNVFTLGSSSSWRTLAGKPGSSSCATCKNVWVLRPVNGAKFNWSKL